MERLKQLQHSKKASMSIPSVVKVLEAHDERLLLLEGLVIGKSLREAPPAAEIEELPEVEIPETIPDEISAYEEAVIEKPQDQLEYEAGLLDELLDTLTRIQDEASLVECELKSIKAADLQEAEEVTEFDDSVSINTECTDACRELVNNSGDEVPDHDFDCKHCLKAKAKAIKRARKQKEKERRAQVKRIKEKEKSLLLLEQQEIAMKLKSLRMGLSTVDILAETRQRLEGDFSNLTAELISN